MNEESIDIGTAYARQPGHYDAALPEVAAGTPIGELMRRYWQAVATALDATTTPRTISKRKARTVSLHSEEHLLSSDRGVVMLRRLLRKQMAIVPDGGDPIGLAFEPGRELRRRSRFFHQGSSGRGMTARVSAGIKPW